MKIILRSGSVLVVLGEAVHEGRPFDARDPECVGSLARSAGWTGPVKSAEQVHGTRILGCADSGPGDAFLLEAGDAAVVRHADCWPVVVADPVRSRAVLAHCGWRGAVGGLAGDSVRALLARGSEASDLTAFCGPGISPESFEVGPEVAARFPEHCRSTTRWGTPSIDLGAFLRSDLEAAGVPSGSILVDSRDTMTDPGLHSHRRDAAHAGRMGCLCMVGQVV